MCNETTLMLAKYKTDKALINMRRNPAAERYLKKKQEERYNKGLAILFGMCLSVLLLMFIYY